MTECNRDAARRLYMKGVIVNSGTQDLRYVTVRSIWKNRVGLEVGGETFYALAGTVLRPGEQQPFRHSTKIEFGRTL
ncbi:MAG: hypothetical protein U5O39_13645 [Gammaproteobacteria bacterium]|nr:hypothetical protein [Gammaproteobacteria bacterium]